MLARIGIKAKILSVLLLLGLISLSGLAYVSLRFSQANATYHGFITNESKAAVLGARAAAGIWTAVSMAGRLMELPTTAPNYQPMKDSSTATSRSPWSASRWSAKWCRAGRRRWPRS